MTTEELQTLGGDAVMFATFAVALIEAGVTLTSEATAVLEQVQDAAKRAESASLGETVTEAYLSALVVDRGCALIARLNAAADAGKEVTP